MTMTLFDLFILNVNCRHLVRRVPNQEILPHNVGHVLLISQNYADNDTISWRFLWSVGALPLFPDISAGLDRWNTFKVLHRQWCEILQRVWCEESRVRVLKGVWCDDMV